MRAAFNLEILQSFGAKGQILDELATYGSHAFERVSEHPSIREVEAPHIKAYEGYVRESEVIGVFDALKQHLVQLQFPIETGISQTTQYKEVVIRGKAKGDGPGLRLYAPEQIRLQVFPDDLIGKVPVLLVPDKRDFKAIICALTKKNEPVEIPSSMGAAFIKGLNNWSRIRELRKMWTAEHPLSSWGQEFRQNILPNHKLYQDQLIVLSEQPYSNVPAEALHLGTEAWKSHSVKIRRAHECAHLFTLQQYGKMTNHIFDELIADYVGITSVLGRFDKNWFLHFMGLENGEGYREGGRFQNYLRDLSSGSASILQNIVRKAASSLEQFDLENKATDRASDRKNRIKAICETGLIPLASPEGVKLLKEKYESYEMTLA